MKYRCKLEIIIEADDEIEAWTEFIERINPENDKVLHQIDVDEIVDLEKESHKKMLKNIILFKKVKKRLLKDGTIKYSELK